MKHYSKNLINQILVTVLLIFIVYSNTFDNDFVWDDIKLIRENVKVHYLKYIPLHFTQCFFGPKPATSQTGQIHYWRPLTLISFNIDFFFWGHDPLGYHLTNILIHSLNAILVLLLLRALTITRPIAFYSALIFAIHPVQTNAVSYISGRTDLLAAAFFLLACVFFMRYISREKAAPINILWLALCLALSVMAKEATLIAPLLLLLLGLFTERAIKRRVCLSVLTAVVAVASLTILRPLLGIPIGDWRSAITETSAMSLLAAAESLVLYARLFLLPVGLHMERFLSLPSARDPQALLCASIFALALFLAIRGLLRRRLEGFLFFWSLIALLPASNIVPLYPSIAKKQIFMGEQFLYLPSVGLSAAAALLLYNSINWSKSLSSTILGIGLVALTLLGILTYTHNEYWRDRLTFYEETIRHYPGSSRMRLNLGLSYAEQERYEEALKMILPTIRENPLCSTCHFALGKVYYELGNYAEAKREFMEAVELEPLLAIGHNNLGVIAMRNGDIEGAAIHYRAALKTDPFDINIRINLAAAYRKQGKTDLAVTELREALAVDPRSIRARYILALAYEEKGHVEKAIEEYRTILRDYPDFKLATERLDQLSR